MSVMFAAGWRICGGKISQGFRGCGCKPHESDQVICGGFAPDRLGPVAQRVPFDPVYSYTIADKKIVIRGALMGRFGIEGTPGIVWKDK